MIRTATLLAGAAASLSFFWETPAAAAPPSCDAITALGPGGTATTTPAPAVVYVTGSSAAKPLLAALAPIIFADPVSPATIVYRNQGSCDGPNAILNGVPMANTDGTTALYWDPNSTTVQSSTVSSKEQQCVLPNPTFADIGISDVFAQTCGYATQGLPSGISDFQGPIQAMTFAVPKNSKEDVISAEAAYLTFGLGVVAPWVDATHFFVRNDKSGTQRMISSAIRVNASHWKGVDKGNSDGVFAALTAQVSQDDNDKSIAILSSDYSARPDVKQLAYQHFGQRCGVKPDLNPLDKRNVRDGRYAIWGPLHLLSQVDSSGQAKNTHARDLIAYLQGVKPPPLGVNLIRTEVLAHVVPPCAMNVQRTSEMGPIQSFKPQLRCGCAFDKEALGSTTCTACSDASPCSGNASCNFGFCEAP
jgi:ABC-type phosphate transport system substrate-binding protein